MTERSSGSETPCQEQQGDQGTVEQLLGHHAWIRRIAHGRVGEGDADDVAQNVWVSCIQHPPRPATARSWLRTVALNLVRDGWRSERRRLVRQALAEASRPCPDSPEDLLVRAEQRRSLLEQMRGLKEQHRQTIVLRYFEDLSTAEIAQVLAVPAGTVRRRLKEGLDQLRVASGVRTGRRPTAAPLRARRSARTP
jgi:RNA polymerase sigma-70 factor (ECF subfamily)